MNVRARVRLAPLYLLLLLAPGFDRPAAAQGPTFYVATTGSDTSGDGSNANPWATIEHAVDQMPDTSTILVKPGLYNGRVRIDGGAPGRTFAQGIIAGRRRCARQPQHGHALHRRRRLRAVSPSWRV